MGKSDDENSAIDIYLRVRPVERPSDKLKLDGREKKAEFLLPREEQNGLASSGREHHEYRFTDVFQEDAKQDEVFDKVARRVVFDALDGKNGTVFAYGQTGSGKTFTITGGSERYADRGIIPRAISLIFSEIAKRSDAQYAVHISYMEIYNEQPHDLLDDENGSGGLDDLRQVSLREDEEGSLHFVNLSVHRANTEEDALNLLFLGDTNRAISETPMNMASSRSHCIFCISIESRQPGSEKVRRSKLNLVDLAGSERASKTGLDGSVLREAKYINLSLHYLQQVIVALQERASGHGRPHVPYRNSAMTSILRDSLGGNCKTVMVANVTPEPTQLEESISTCRFAQRVAMISNRVQVNEELDPASVIKRLKQENRELKEEIKFLKGSDEDSRSELTDGEVERIRRHIETYVDSDEPAAMPEINMNMLEIRTTWQVFRELCRRRASGTRDAAERAAKSAPSLGSERSNSKRAPSEEWAAVRGGDEGGGGGENKENEDLAAQVQKLQLQVKQRDNEINILVSMLEKQQAKGTAPKVKSNPESSDALQALRAERQRQNQNEMERVSSSSTTSTSQHLDKSEGSKQQHSDSGGEQNGRAKPMEAGWAAIPSVDVLSDANLLADRNKAFELFRKSYRKSEAIEENKQELKRKYGRAKELGQAVNDARANINELKSKLQQRRAQLGVAEVAAGDGRDDHAEKDATEEDLKRQLEQEKSSYRESFNSLRDLKAEIEHLQKLLEGSRKKLQADFEEWLKMVVRQQQEMGVLEKREGALMPTEQSSPSKKGTSASMGSVNSNDRSIVSSNGQRGGASQLVHHPPSTGDDKADAEIRAFYQAREKVVKGL